MNFTYRFPAVKGHQAGREYYISMVPLKLLARLFPAEEEVVPAEHRAQRRINEARIPEIKKYILDNRDSYVFSALSASIDGKYSFSQLMDSDVGVLEVDMESVFLINDGQHRKAAIEAAMQEDPSLEKETISIVFFGDEGLARSQQMFTDLNKHAVKTSNSLATLYDGRDEIAVATKKVIDVIPFFRRFTDKERDILGKNSSNLFTLNMIYKANQRILRGDHCSEEDTEFLIFYWRCVADNIVEWQEVLNRTLTKKALRENYIVTLAITISAFGRLGRYFYDCRNIDMAECLKKLRTIDWLRSNPMWTGRTIRENGKVQNSEEAISLTCAVIKQQLGISLTKEELQKEKQIVENT
jgi:DNA sulfur modification protein DndB